MNNELVPKIVNLFNLEMMARVGYLSFLILDLPDDVEKMRDLDTQTEVGLGVLLSGREWQAVVK